MSSKGVNLMGSKSTNNLNLKAKLKLTKKQWDDRFWLSQMPEFESEYDPVQLEINLSEDHTSSQRNIKLPKIEFTPQQGTEKTPNSNARRNSEESINHLIQAIEKEWDTQEIPEAQREIFRFCVFCLPRHKSAPIIIKEIEDLRRRRSFVQLALRAVAAREESLKSIKEMNDYLERATDWQKMKDVKLEAAELLHAHRMLSLSATECVVKWRDQLMNAMLVNNPDNLRKVRILPFMWQGVSYIHKMKTDMDFLIFSDYAKIFKFSEKLDPMLISPSKPDKKKPAKIKENYFVEDGQVLIPIPDVLLKRVKWAESIILGEPYFEEDITSDPLKAFQNLDAFEDKNDLAQSLLITILEEALDFDLIETAKDARNLENSRFNDLSCKSICEEWAKVVAVQTAEEIGREIYREQSNDVLEKHFNAKFEKLMENEINKIVDAIAKEEIKSAKDDVKRIRNLNKAKNQEDIALSKLIYQELQDQAIRGMIEQEAQRVIDLRDKKAIKQQIAAEQKQLQLDNLEICKQLTFQYIDEILSGMDPEYERWIHEEIERREQIRESQIQTSLKALELSNMQISEALLRRLIETVISELKPDSFADSILNELIVDRKKNTKDAAALKRLETKELSLTNQKICEIIYEIILDESITQFNFEKLAENMIEAVSSERRRTTLTRTMTLAGASVVDEPEDYANENFTPGEHSPNEYSLAEHEMFEEEEEKEDSMSLGGIIGDLGLDFATIDMFKDLTGLVFRPISVAESQIIHVLNEYCRFIPSMNMSILPDINQLLQEVTSGIDPSWYWALKNDRILGMVVYSLDCIATTGRNLVIHHMSCLNELSFKDITDAAVDYMFKIDACDEIRINLWSPIGTDISAEYKRIFSELKFKWKTNTSKAEYQSAITVMGKSRSGNPNPDARKSQVMPFSLKAGCIIEVSSERVNPRDVTCEEMTQVGNRHCLLFGILNVFGKLNKNGIVLNQTPGTRLQGDVTDLLAIVNSTDSYNFPSIKGAVLANQEQSAKYLQSNGIDPRSAPQDKASIAILDISYKWKSCINMVHQVRGQPFKFLRFKSNDLKLMKTDNLDIFSIPTSQQNLVAFFIRCEGMKRELQGELKRNKTDLYNKFEDAFKNVGAAAQKPSELWVPAFQKEVACDLPWIEGYEIPPQRNETESQHIKKCRESVRIEVNAETPSAGCLVIPKQKGQILNKDFVFGLTYLNVDKTLDAPIFMCLVENGDWIAA